MSKFNFDPALIETLAALLDRTGLSEIEVAEGESRIRIARNATTVVQAAAAPATAAPREAPAAVQGPPEGTVSSPMVGTVYLAPEPGAAPFVSVGQRVQDGQTLLIVEAMKVMNPIRASRGGVVTEIFVQNDSPVEFGEPLLVIA